MLVRPRSSAHLAKRTPSPKPSCALRPKIPSDRSSFRSPIRQSEGRRHRKIFSPGRRIARSSALEAHSPPIIRGGHPFRIDQVNNAYVFPGVGLAAIAIEARRISEGMFLAAARAIADLSPAKRDPHANLLPPLAESRAISLQVAIAVAEQAAREGLAGRLPKDDLAIAVKSMMWEPIYSTYQRPPPTQHG
jgi:hypothetical protein